MEIFGYIAGIIGAICLIPEIQKALKTHHLKDISWLMLLLMAISALLWVLYGLHLRAYPLIASDSISLAATLFLMALKFRYSKGKKPLLN